MLVEKLGQPAGRGGKISGGGALGHGTARAQHTAGGLSPQCAGERGGLDENKVVIEALAGMSELCTSWFRRELHFLADNLTFDRCTAEVHSKWEDECYIKAVGSARIQVNRNSLKRLQPSLTDYFILRGPN